MITRDTILAKTHYGTGIYSYILRQFYPGETVMKISGRDCGICRNPYAGGVTTLHIWHEKIYPDQKLSPEIARHKDQFDAIPPGDCFDFARLYWKKDGQELLIAINEDLHLHLEDGYCPYGPKDIQTAAAHDANLVRFSFFKAPVTNTIPHKSITLVDAYNYIRGDYARKETAELRSFTDLKRARLYKRTHFHYCTFSGTFSSRADSALIEHSGLLCVDFDHIREWQALHDALLNDEYFATQLLYRSPSGDGIKWIIPVNLAEMPHEDYFHAVSAYCQATYGYEPDKNCKDVSRACFLPYDPDVYINPELLPSHE